MTKRKPTKPHDRDRIKELCRVPASEPLARMALTDDAKLKSLLRSIDSSASAEGVRRLLTKISTERIILPPAPILTLDPTSRSTAFASGIDHDLGGKIQDNDNLNQMITSAKTPADHEGIAVYYDAEAAENEKKASLHSRNKNMYSKLDFLAHCNALIGGYQQTAEQDKALAAFHRKMAKKGAEQ